MLAGANGVIAHLRPGTLIIEMTTTAPHTKKALHDEARAKGVDFVECPVGKTVEHAIAGTLSLMAGGDAESIERARPIFDAMGSEVHVCGDVGAASAMKLINNALVACINAASIEALVAGYGGDDTPGSMLRVCEARGGVRVTP